MQFKLPLQIKKDVFLSAFTLTPKRKQILLKIENNVTASMKTVGFTNRFEEALKNPSLKKIKEI